MTRFLGPGFAIVPRGQIATQSLSFLAFSETKHEENTVKITFHSCHFRKELDGHNMGRVPRYHLVDGHVDKQRVQQLTERASKAYVWMLQVA